MKTIGHFLFRMTIYFPKCKFDARFIEFREYLLFTIQTNEHCDEIMGDKEFARQLQKLY